MKTTLRFVCPVMFSVNNFSSSSRQVRKCGVPQTRPWCVSPSLQINSHFAIIKLQTELKLFPINVSCLNLYTISCAPHLYPGTRRSYYFSYKKPFPTTLREFSVGFIGWLEIIWSVCACGKWSSHFCLSRSLVASSECTAITFFKIFRIPCLIRWIQQKNYEKLTDLAKDWTHVACLAVSHSNHYTLESFLCLCETVDGS